MGVLLYLLSAGLHYAALAAEESREAALRAAEAHTLARDAELHALRMQINPHFLFNSLHSIAALATLDGARAREMCIRLADFLRSSLGLGERESIPLREELALARSYLEVEQVRFGARLQFSEDIQDILPGLRRSRAAAAAAGGKRRQARDRRTGGGRRDPPVGGAPRRRSCASPWRTGSTRTRRRPTGSAWACRTSAAAWNCAMATAASFEAGGREGVYRVELRFPCESPIASSSRA